MKSSNLSSIIITLLVLTLIILPLIIAQEAQLTDEEIAEIDKLIANKDFKAISEFSVEKKNQIISDPTKRQEVLEGIARDSLKRKASTRISEGEGSFLQKLGKSATEHGKVDLIKFTGFESAELRFTKDNVISDGKVEIDLESMPEGLASVDYSEGGVKLTFESKAEITYAKGKVDADLRYTSKDIPSSTVDKGKTILEPGKGNIAIDKDGKFKLELNAAVKVGDRIFERIDAIGDGETTFKLVGGGRFKGTNLKVTTDSAEIFVDSDIETDILFSEGGIKSDQFVQLTGTNSKKHVRIKGDNIEVNLLKKGLESEKVFVTGEGKNLLVKNGDDQLKIDNGEIYKRRRLTGEPIVDAEVSAANKPGTKAEVTPGKGTNIKKGEDPFVCVGKFCEIVANPIAALSGSDPVLQQFPFDTPIGKTSVTQTEIFAREGDISKILKEAPRGLSKQEFGEQAGKSLGDTKIVITTQRDLTLTQLDNAVTDSLGDIGLPKNELDRVEKFRTKTYSSLPSKDFGSFFSKDIQQFAPKGSQITIVTDNSGKKQGIFTLKINGKSYPITIGGDYIQRLVQRSYSSFGEAPPKGYDPLKSLTIDELYQEYKSQ